MTKSHHTTFDPTHRLLETGLAGTVQSDDVEAWTVELTRTLHDLPDDSTFALIFDLRTYESGTLDAHKAMRTVIPDALARHGMRPAYIDLFDPAPEMTIDSRPSARCVAFANVHHNTERMVDYEQRAGTTDQRFFSDVDAAREWIRAFK